MTFKIWDGSSWRDPSFVRRWNGSSWVDVAAVKKWDGSTWVTVWPIIRVSIVGATIIEPTAGTATYGLLSSGQEQYNTTSSGTVSIGTWLVSGVNSDYQVRATLNSGSLSSGTTGSWLAMSSNRSWTVSGTGAGANLTIEVRDATTLTVLDTAEVDLFTGF